MDLFVVNATVSLLAAIVLHEMGHFFAARLCAVPIKQAGLGWGPKLYGVRLNQVDYQVRLLPIGAYIQMDMLALQRRPLLQQLFVLGAGIGVNLTLAVIAWGTLFGVLNLALAVGNLVPLYQLDGWKSGMVICRRMFGRPSPLVEWIMTLGGGAIALAVLIRAFLSF
ncbi:MAG TPA: site-2 protease family protein [Pyrinomonadaceae bacterium]|nr:site-2 protease family protein [Pyrinomonadaceae bacterium]